jgi:hypothetical protein
MEVLITFPASKQESYFYLEKPIWENTFKISLAVGNVW